MSRYIDAEALTDYMLEHYNDLCEKHGDYDHYTTGYGDAIDAIENAPTADVVEVVRCKDCKYLQVINDGKVYAKCTMTDFEFLPFGTDTREHYCSYGERRDYDIRTSTEIS